MSALTSIQWTDRTWNPVRGCSLVSPGCTNCYAMRQARRFDFARVPVFVKQLGAKPYIPEIGDDFTMLKLCDSKGGDISEWPEHLRVCEFPTGGANV